MGDGDENVKKIFELKGQLDEFSLIAEERDLLKAEIEKLSIENEYISDLQNRLIDAEKTIQELDSIFIQYNEEKKKNVQFQSEISDLINQVKTLETDVVMKNDQILSQELLLEDEKSKYQDLQVALAMSGKKAGYVHFYFLPYFEYSYEICGNDFKRL